MIKIEFSIVVRKPSADVLSYHEYVDQHGTASEKTELAHLRSCDQELYSLYPSLPQPNNGLEVNGEYICFDDISDYYQFEQHLMAIYDQRAKDVTKVALAYCMANNIYVHRVVREVDEIGQVYGQSEGFEDN